MDNEFWYGFRWGIGACFGASALFSIFMAVLFFRTDNKEKGSNNEQR